MSGQPAPGSILLHMTKGEISKLIAWADNGQYSHAAIVIDNDTIAEAVAAGVRLYSLKQRLSEKDEFHWIDARAPAQPLGAGDLAAVAAVAQGYIGTPYPLNELLLLGVLCAARDKIPENEVARLVVRMALDYAIDADPKAMVCSEFVFRCFAEAATVPVHRLAPRIVIAPPKAVPFPDIDWLKLWQEYEDARQRAHGGPALPELVRAQDRRSDSAGDEVRELREKAARVRARLAAGRAGSGAADAAAAAATPVLDDPSPNPKMVTPGDLGGSPSFGPTERVVSSE